MTLTAGLAGSLGSSTDAEALSELAKHGATMAIYLSVGRIEEVVKALADAYGQDAPVVVAYRVSWPDQRILEGTLQNIAGKVREASIDRHALILVGPAMASKESKSQSRSKLYDRTFSHGFRKGSND